MSTLLSLLFVSSAGAQERKHFEEERPPGSASALEVTLELGCSRLDLRPSEGSLFYRAEVDYNAEWSRLEHRFTPPSEPGGEAHLSLRLMGKRHGPWGRWSDCRESDRNRVVLELSREVPVEIEAELEGVEGRMELGGIALGRLDLDAAAVELEVGFEDPNPGTLENLILKLAAGEFFLKRLGNSHFRRVDIKGIAGDLTLDLTGDWRRDAEISIDMGVGNLELDLPGDLGVQVHKDSFLSSFDSTRFIKRGARYYSRAFETRPYHLRVDLDLALVAIDIHWVE